jgi:hypothetical protein
MTLHADAAPLVEGEIVAEVQVVRVADRADLAGMARAAAHASD